MALGEVFLIPTVLQDDETALESLPINIINTVRNCQVIFTENERTTRRHLKKMDRNIVIDNFQWFTIGKIEDSILDTFSQQLQLGKNVAIVSEAGCPGIADPGQFLIAEAQKINAKIHPLVGPSSILLALMASGMNGQNFHFMGYLPVDTTERKNAIRKIESMSINDNCTFIFIETPYRNVPLVKDIISNTKPSTRLCIAANITAASENIRTKSIQDWKKEDLNYLHKQPTIFLLDGGRQYAPKSHY
ncbi:MAG: SAM-dependent methyltransferase [Pseudopedobacter saltans]|uniref:SAM-dependent methyltransferase n=1 Tax=Pseudopedobacter saltans TaxID=151895 RepID=A0A2W5F6R8_9SPHI|nr:MAG: SAM-dependent methyltransferase [Pseudopedobacter saltans]